MILIVHMFMLFIMHYTVLSSSVSKNEPVMSLCCFITYLFFFFYFHGALTLNELLRQCFVELYDRSVTLNISIVTSKKLGLTVYFMPVPLYGNYLTRYLFFFFLFFFYILPFFVFIQRKCSLAFVSDHSK